MRESALRALVEAAALDGFRQQASAAALTLCGQVEVCGRSHEIRIAFDSLDLVDPPRFELADTKSLPRPVTPHVDEDGEICVVDRSRHVFDRYHAPEQLRGLIARAREILSGAAGSSATLEIEREFPRYWGRSARNIGPAEERTSFLRTDRPLSFDRHQARPDTLGDLLTWARAWDPDLAAAIIPAFNRLGALDPTLVIDAPNATIGAQLMVSSRGRAFVGALSRPQGWQRFLGTRKAHNIEIERFIARRSDMETILALNGSPLANKAIIMVGCGAIGGYLARMLVQLGAGFGGGRLMLVDHDKLEAFNVRRHALGMDCADKPKAEACADALRRDFPGVSITVRPARAESQQLTFEAADLILDVAGEQALSEWLNDWALERARGDRHVPSMIHGWVAGHGAAAQCFLSTDPDFACYRCLQPDHGERPRFDPLRDAVEEPVGECGAIASLPYGPQAPAQAAALVAEHAADWARGKFRPLLRTVRVDWDATVKRDLVSPKASPKCPACSVE